MGIQASQGCDQIPVKQTRETCRGSLNTNFNIFYSVGFLNIKSNNYSFRVLILIESFGFFFYIV